MNAPAMRDRRRRPSVQAEEERAWVAFYQRAGRHPEIAAEVLTQLDLDPEMKREHLALYLCCRETLRLQAARSHRDQRIGAAVRWILGGVFQRLPESIGRMFSRVGDVAMASIPLQPHPRQAEPAIAKVRRLTGDPAMRAARAAYKASPAGTPTTDAGAEPVAMTMATAATQRAETAEKVALRPQVRVAN
jgi:hypothetical protein